MAESVLHRSIAALALLLLAPSLLVIAVAIRLGSPGPVLFRQQRVGRDGRLFEIYKFRTMVDGAHLLAANVSPEGDPRITRVGRLLRAWYLDELPQLANVLKGDMALVGPRPETPEFVARYSPEERAVLSVRPGLAGPSTLAFMDEAEILGDTADAGHHYTTVVMHERVAADLRYLNERSLTYDLRLLCRQVVAIIRKGMGR